MNLRLLFLVSIAVNLVPLAASAVTFDDLTDALNVRRACHVEEILIDQD